jgi:hypothetical protein
MLGKPLQSRQSTEVAKESSVADLPNMLEAFKDRKPSAALTHNAKTLLDVAKQLEPLSHAQAVTYGTHEEIAKLKDEVMQNLYSAFGSKKGPVINAREEVENCIKLAIELRYPVNHKVVTKQLGWFLLSLVTDGFDDEDINGTQIGNYLGLWRGGGFS